MRGDIVVREFAGAVVMLGARARSRRGSQRAHAVEQHRFLRRERDRRVEPVENVRPRHFQRSSNARLALLEEGADALLGIIVR